MITRTAISRQYRASQIVPVGRPCLHGTGSRAGTWAEMVEAEPRLAAIDAEVVRFVSKHRRHPGYCGCSAWFSGPGSRPGFRRLMWALAGWTAEAWALRTQTAYDTCYRRFYHDRLAEPSCWHDGDTDTDMAAVERWTSIMRTEIEEIAARLGIDPHWNLRASRAGVIESLDGVTTYALDAEGAQ